MTSPATPADASLLNVSPAELVAEGNRQLQALNLEASETLFRQVLSQGANADASYGMGVIQFGRRNRGLAKQHFDAVLALEPANPNALYYRAMIAEEDGNLIEACRFYNLTLLACPEHRLARERRAELTLNRKFRDQTRVQGVPNPVDRLGVYAHLLQDPTYLSSYGLAAIAALSLQASPPASVFLGMAWAYLWNQIRKARLAILAAAILVMPLLVAAEFASPLKPSLPNSLAAIVLGFAGAVLWWLFVWWILWAVVRSWTTQVVIDKGRLQVSWGLLGRHRSNLELWRIQSLELHRGLINRMTGTGYFRVETHDKATYLIPGPEEGKKLDQLFQELLDLVYLLRANPIIKGIIY